MAASLSEQVGKVFNERASAVVRVESSDRHGRLSGTGFFADPMGTIYTVYSTVGDAQDVTVVFAGERLPAKVLIADARSGVALLKVERSTPFIPVASTRELRLATPVISIGFPHDLDASPSFGIIGGFDRKYRDRFFVTTHLRASVPVQAGFGGAPLLNLSGEAVGMVIAGIDGGSSCFVLPIEAVDKIRHNFVRFGEARHGWVGVTVEELPGEPVKIAELGPQTPAAKSGLREGDVLIQVGEVPIKKVEDVLDASYFLTDGDAVEVRVNRDGQEMRFSVYSITHPASEKPGLHAAGVPAEFILQPK